MSKDLLEPYEFNMVLTGIVCVIIIVQAHKFLERKDRLPYWKFLWAILVGVPAGKGLGRIYLNLWPSTPEWSLKWVADVADFVLAGYFICLILYTLLVLTRIIKHPST